MRHALAPLAAAVVLVVAATAFLTQAGPPHAPGAAREAAADASWHDATVVSFDGTEIRVTAFRPAGASAATPVPVVLHSHGWSGSRATSPTGMAAALLDAGFGVVSIDARGHGESGGFATVHHKDWEVKDFQAVLDWVHDELPWVQREHGSGIPKDVVAGGAGYSYAGAFQLMAASYDRRLDAIAPEITWSDLPDALAPDGAIKSVWVNFLYWTAKESGTRVDPRVDTWYRQAAIENRFPQEALDHFAGSSPLLDRIEADVLLIQGIPDVLFPLNHAMRTYRALEENASGDVRLFTHLTGHVLPYAQPFGTTDTRRQIFADDGPCGRITDIVVRWMHQHLRGGPESGIPEASFALDDASGCVRLDAVPHETLVARVDAVVVPSGAGSVLVPLAEGPVTIAGVPRLSATAALAAAEGRAFASLVVVGADGHARVVDDQTQPFRFGPGLRVDRELAGVAARLDAGDRLFLRLDGLNEWYAINSARAPGGAVLQDVAVTLPVVATPAAAR